MPDRNELLLSQPSNQLPNWDWIDINEVPSTNRSAEGLSSILGYDDVSGLADTLPRGGVIMDVGSGNSNFFFKLASARPDITAINFDFAYSKPNTEITTGLSNLLHMAGDMRQMPFKEESFDWIFSYWALSYLIEHEKRIVIGDLYKLVKPYGQLSIGPVYDANSGSIKPETARTIIKDPLADPNQWIAETAAKIRDHPDHLFISPLDK